MNNFVGAYITGLFDSKNACNSGTTATDLARSLITDYVFWSIHVDEAGNLSYNNVPLATNGTVTSNFICLKAVIDKGRSEGNCERVWLSIGSGGTQDYTNIANLLITGQESNLINNLLAVADGLGIYGFDFDNEDQIGNVEVIVSLTRALYQSKDHLRFSFCPFGPSVESERYWIECLTAIFQDLRVQPVEGFNLQCYAGGRDSDPIVWTQAITVAQDTGVENPASFIRPGLAVQGSANGPTYEPQQMAEKFQ